MLASRSAEMRRGRSGVIVWSYHVSALDLGCCSNHNVSQHGQLAGTQRHHRQTYPRASPWQQGRCSQLASARRPALCILSRWIDRSTVSLGAPKDYQFGNGGKQRCLEGGRSPTETAAAIKRRALCRGFRIGVPTYRQTISMVKRMPESGAQLSCMQVQRGISRQAAVSLKDGKSRDVRRAQGAGKQVMGVGCWCGCWA